ncbi:MAG: S1 RNA-binding domain-containing protein [Anaerolineae bacterium]|nr:S1 RNA-binding domain-containing protein [Anaerolineae bacterium]
MPVVYSQVSSINELQPKMCLKGVVKETQLYGAVIDLGLEYDGVVHISQLAPKRVNSVTDVVRPGDSVTVWVTQVNPKKGRISLTMVEPPAVEWHELQEEQVYTGTVTRMEPYGVFVDIGAERPGLLHVREMSEGYVRHPSEKVKVGDQVVVRILRLDRQRKRIDLSMKGIQEEMPEDDPGEEEEPARTTMELALYRAQQSRREKRQRKAQRRRLDFSEREEILERTLSMHRGR